MVFYEIEILSVPEIRFAWDVEVERYKNKFRNKENFLEIALCKEGRILFEYENGETEITEGGMLLPVLSDISCTTRAYENERQRHITVGMNLSYSLCRYENESECDVASLKERMKSGRIALIPFHCELEEYREPVENTLRKIVSGNSFYSGGSRLAVVGHCYTLLGKLSDFVLKRLNCDGAAFSPSEELYAEKAAEYITKNYSKKIAVRDISGYLGISEGYLHRIFKNVKGCSIVEFINRYRIRIAAELMENRAVSLKDAAYNVGIDDPAYMSRLFKKVMGVNYREYLKK